MVIENAEPGAKLNSTPPVSLAAIGPRAACLNSMPWTVHLLLLCLKFYFFYSLCVAVSACMSMLYVSSWCPWKLEGNLRSPGTGVVHAWELPLGAENTGQVSARNCCPNICLFLFLFFFS